MQFVMLAIFVLYISIGAYLTLRELIEDFNNGREIPVLFSIAYLVMGTLFLPMKWLCDFKIQKK